MEMINNRYRVIKTLGDEDNLYTRHLVSDIWNQNAISEMKIFDYNSIDSKIFQIMKKNFLKIKSLPASYYLKNLHFSNILSIDGELSEEDYFFITCKYYENKVRLDEVINELGMNQIVILLVDYLDVINKLLKLGFDYPYFNCKNLYLDKNNSYKELIMEDLASIYIQNFTEEKNIDEDLEKRYIIEDICKTIVFFANKNLESEEITCKFFNSDEDYRIHSSLNQISKGIKEEKWHWTEDFISRIVDKINSKLNSNFKLGKINVEADFLFSNSELFNEEKIVEIYNSIEVFDGKPGINSIFLDCRDNFVSKKIIQEIDFQMNISKHIVFTSFSFRLNKKESFWQDILLKISQYESIEENKSSHSIYSNETYESCFDSIAENIKQSFTYSKIIKNYIKSNEEKISNKTINILIDRIDLADEVSLLRLEEILIELAKLSKVNLILTYNRERIDKGLEKNSFIKYLELNSQKRHFNLNSLEWLNILSFPKESESFLEFKSEVKAIVNEDIGFYIESLRYVLNRKLIYIDEKTGQAEINKKTKYKIPERREELYYFVYNDLSFEEKKILDFISVYSGEIRKDQLEYLNRYGIIFNKDVLKLLVEKNILSLEYRVEEKLYSFSSEDLKDYVYKNLKEREKLTYHSISYRIAIETDNSNYRVLALHYSKNKKDVRETAKYLEKIALALVDKKELLSGFVFLEKSADLYYDVEDFEKASFIFNYLSKNYIEYRMWDKNNLFINKLYKITNELESPTIINNYYEVVLFTSIYKKNAKLYTMYINELEAYNQRLKEPLLELCIEYFKIRFEFLQGNKELSINILKSLLDKSKLVENGKEYYKYLLKDCGVVYFNQALKEDKTDLIEKSIDFSKKYMICSVREKDYISEIKSINNMALSYSYIGETQKALELFKSAYKKSDDIGLVNIKEFIAGNIVNAKIRLGDFSLEGNLCIDIATYPQKEEEFQNFIKINTILARLNYELNKFKDSKKYLDTTFKFAEDNNISKRELNEYYYHLIDYSFSMGLYNEAKNAAKELEQLPYSKSTKMNNIYISYYNLINGNQSEINNIINFIDEDFEYDVFSSLTKTHDILKIIKNIVIDEKILKLLGDEGARKVSKLVAKTKKIKSENIIVEDIVLLSNFIDAFLNKTSSAEVERLLYIKPIKKYNLTAIEILSLTSYRLYEEGEIDKALIIGVNVITSLIYILNEIDEKNWLGFFNNYAFYFPFKLYYNVVNQLEENINFYNKINKKELEKLLDVDYHKLLIENGLIDKFISNNYNYLDEEYLNNLNILNKIKDDGLESLSGLVDYYKNISLAHCGYIILMNPKSQENVLVSARPGFNGKDIYRTLKKHDNIIGPTILNVQYSEVIEEKYLMVIPLFYDEYSKLELEAYLVLSYKYYNKKLINSIFEKVKMNRNFIYYLVKTIDFRLGSIIDSMTGSLSNYEFNRKLKEDLYKMKKNEKLSYIIYDIDNFKLINDTYGHSFGDFVLKKITEEVKKNLDKDSYIGRTGGEEFGIVLPNKGQEEAYMIAEKIRSNIENYKVSNLDGKVTLTLGLSTFPESGKSSKELVDKADQALYLGKKRGKNQVVLWNKDLTDIKLEKIDILNLMDNDVNSNNHTLRTIVEFLRAPSFSLEKDLLRIMELLGAERITLFKVDKNNLERIISLNIGEFYNDLEYNYKLIEKVIETEKSIKTSSWKEEVSSSGKRYGLKSIMILKGKYFNKLELVCYLEADYAKVEYREKDLRLGEVLIQLVTKNLLEGDKYEVN